MQHWIVVLRKIVRFGLSRGAEERASFHFIGYIERNISNWDWADVSVLRVEDYVNSGGGELCCAGIKRRNDCDR